MSQAGESSFLETSRLILRDFCDQDSKRIVEYFSEREALPYILRRQRRSENWSSYVASAMQYAREFPIAERVYIGFAVALRATNELIGMCSLSNAQCGSKVACIGWHYSRRYSGCGFATEAGNELIRYAFEERRIASVYSDCFESNVANVRVFLKLGMQPSQPIWISKWLLALKYREFRPIVRFVIDNPRIGAGTRAA
jgi:[ribosomal protein S5]-alanine N-acetyltransferase